MTLPPGVVVRRVEAGDWRHVRDLRLQMLLDTPKAYLERHEDALRLDDAHWQARVESHTGPDSGKFAAVGADGVWIGTAAAYLETPGQVHLVSVFVAPTYRGTGVMAALLAATQDWARAAGGRVMRLLVHEENARARAYYRKAGFAETGATTPYDLEPTEREIEMAVDLGQDG